MNGLHHFGAIDLVPTLHRKCGWRRPLQSAYWSPNLRQLQNTMTFGWRVLASAFQTRNRN